jgi:hypothetical protein
MKKRNLIAAATTAALLSAVPLSASAALFGFTCISTGATTDCNAGQAQSSVETTAVGTTAVTFTFRNTGSTAFAITDVYFDVNNTNLLSLTSPTITNGTGVLFTSPATPPNLPGGGTFSSDFSADAAAPVATNGVNPGETLAITFNLTAGSTFAGVNAAIVAGTIDIGVHEQAFADQGSISLVNLPTGPGTSAPIPEPGTLGLLGAGLAMLGIGRRKLKLKS